jgi:hypothetical protein
MNKIPYAAMEKFDDNKKVTQAIGRRVNVNYKRSINTMINKKPSLEE